MTRCASLLDRAVRSLERLHRILEHLAGQVRDEVSRAVGETVADAIRQAVRTILGDPCIRPPPELPPLRRSPYWNDPDYDDPYDPDGAYGRSDPGWRDEQEERRDDRLSAPGSPGSSGVRRPPRWLQATLIALQLAAWWLRRQTGRFPLLTACGLGLLSGVAVLVGGPLSVAGTSLTTSFVTLLTLADASASAASALPEGERF